MQAFVEQGVLCGSSIEVMLAIWEVAGSDIDEAARIWATPIMLEAMAVENIARRINPNAELSWRNVMTETD